MLRDEGPPSFWSAGCLRINSCGLFRSRCCDCQMTKVDFFFRKICQRCGSDLESSIRRCSDTIHDHGSMSLRKVLFYGSDGVFLVDKRLVVTSNEPCNLYGCQVAQHLSPKARTSFCNSPSRCRGSGLSSSGRYLSGEGLSPSTYAKPA